MKLTIAVAIFCAALVPGSLLVPSDVRAEPQAAATKTPLLYEVRVYRIKPGMMEEFVKFMGEKLIPYEERMGVKVTGQFVAAKDNTYVWIRTWTDLATQKRINDEVHATAEWKETIAPFVGKYIEKVETPLITTPTPYSKAQ